MIKNIFDKLAVSDFRSKFKLSQNDKNYIIKKGFSMIEKHAGDFVLKRISPSFIPNDGKQTPMKGHPVFTAQHATATCCRKCIKKWQ